MSSYDIGKLVHGTGPFVGINPGSGSTLINFASLFTAGSVLQSVQSDLGLTVSGTLFDTGGAGPVLTFSGSLLGPVVPIWVKCTTGGTLNTWTYSIYYDGLGTTAAMTGTSASTITLTGAGAGLTLNIAAGTAPLNNIWKATCSGLADQSGNGWHYTQPTASAQMIITAGLNGIAGLAASPGMGLISSLNLPAPGTTPYTQLFVARWTAVTVNQCFLNGTANTHPVYIHSGFPAVSFYNGADVIINATSMLTLGTWVEAESLYSNSASDDKKVGTDTTTGNSGNNTTTGLIICGNGAAGYTWNGELLALITVLGNPSRTAFRTAVTAKYGASVVI